MRFPIVGIGASAGGLEALELFVAQIPPTSGMAFIVVTHQASDRPTLLPELLSRRTQVPVIEAKNFARIVPDKIYVSTPGKLVSVKDEMLCLTAEASAVEHHLPIDHLFRSLALNEGENAIGVVLSGTGSDGTHGVVEIKGTSGMVMAQDPDSAKYPGMPRSAISTHVVDFVLPPEKMPEQLGRYVEERYAFGRGTDDDADVDVDEGDDNKTDSLGRILFFLRGRTGNDFSGYKRSTVRRRVERRMAVHGIPSTDEYAGFLEENPFEIDALFRELLISVTSFFRDTEAFAALTGELNRLLETKKAGFTLRAWVPGCATGEEAYSVAIILKEILERTDKNVSTQIFATDLDSSAIDKARIGNYPEGIAADVSAERLDRFFVKEDSHYRITKEIREMLVFASQNVIKDPPFTKLDIVACRNLLIYLEPELQKRVLGLFSYSIRPGGILFLGTSESIGDFGDRFANLDKKWKVFQRRDTSPHALPDFPSDLPSAAPSNRRSITHGGPARATPGLAPIAERVLLNQYAPPGAIVSDRGDIVYLHGRTGPFLEPAPGEPTNNIFQMAREGLRLELPAAIRQAAAQDAPIVRRALQVKTNGGFSSITLSVRKITEPEALRGTFMIGFELDADEDEKQRAKASRGRRKHHDRVEALELELQRTKENLQGTIEELETSNEELKSTNEELQSTNEELQSANEELETSREEMQSLNEELQTVNAEFEERNRDLSQANDDMQNLFNSTEIATVFLDEKLAVKRFTRQAKKVFSLIDTDIGRPLSDLTANLRFDSILDDAREVLGTLVFREREIQTKEGSWRQMRIMPYRTHENLIDGLVITFVDIDRVKTAERESQDSRIYAESIVDSMRDALLVVDDEMIMRTGNRAFYELFGTTRRQIEGEPISRLPCVPDRLRLAPVVEKILKSENPTDSVEFDAELPGVGAARLEITGRRIPVASDGSVRALLSIVTLASGGSGGMSRPRSSET